MLFRDLRLFPDAQGQHSLVVTGTRVAGSDATLNTDEPIATRLKPVVSIYEGPSIPDPADRVKVIAAIRDAKSAAGVRTFKSQVSPNDLGGDTWFDITLTQAQLRRRRLLASLPQVELIVSKGVETTVNTLSPSRAVLLSQQVRDALGADSRPGIQLLKQSEVIGLGNLNDAEKGVLRRVINTKDVYPYAAITADDADSIIYLAKPKVAAGTDPDTVRNLPFPPGMPTLRAHLERFQPVLLAATAARNENRPWWTLHRPRSNVLGATSTEAWESFALTARWGGGQRLVVGLAPAGTSPASGLHVLRPASTTIHAAYLCAIYNSSVYQEVASTLPPGQLRAEDLERLGLPHLPDEVQHITSLSLDLAEIVTGLVTTFVGSFPDLGKSLRDDTALSSPPTGVWNRSYDVALAAGPLSGLAWIESVTKHGALNQTIGRVATRVDVFGPAIDLYATKGDKVTLTILLGHGRDAALAPLAAAIRGRIATGAKPSDVLRMQLPVHTDELQRDWESDVASVMAEVTRYRAVRQEVEDLLLHLG